MRKKIQRDDDNGIVQSLSLSGKHERAHFSWRRDTFEAWVLWMFGCTSCLMQSTDVTLAFPKSTSHSIMVPIHDEEDSSKYVQLVFKRSQYAWARCNVKLAFKKISLGPNFKVLFCQWASTLNIGVIVWPSIRHRRRLRWWWSCLARDLRYSTRIDKYHLHTKRKKCWFR